MEPVAQTLLSHPAIQGDIGPGHRPSHGPTTNAFVLRVSSPAAGAPSAGQPSDTVGWDSAIPSIFTSPPVLRSGQNPASAWQWPAPGWGSAMLVQQSLLMVRLIPQADRVWVGLLQAMDNSVATVPAFSLPQSYSTALYISNAPLCSPLYVGLQVCGREGPGRLPGLCEPSVPAHISAKGPGDGASRPPRLPQRASTTRGGPEPSRVELQQHE